MPQNRVDGETFFLTEIPVAGESLKWKTADEVVDLLKQIIVRAYFFRTPDSGEEFEKMPLVVEVLNSLPVAIRSLLLTSYPLEAMTIILLDSISNQPFDEDETGMYQALALI